MIIKVRCEQDFANHLASITMQFHISLSVWSVKSAPDGEKLVHVDDVYIDKLKLLSPEAAASVINFR